MDFQRLRIGIGHDTHRLEPGGPLRLGGIDIPHDRQLVGHSDADVLLHAVIDALLGASGAPDIGQLFPNTDPTNKDRDSRDMLVEVLRRLEGVYRVINLDCIVFAQRPKLASFMEPLREQLAALLNLPSSCVGVKAKTGESVGPVGTEEAMEAQCVVLLVQL